jgi:hypothetical protein
MKPDHQMTTIGTPSDTLVFATGTSGVLFTSHTDGPISGPLVNEISNRITALSAQVAELERDKAVLDWLLMNPRQFPNVLIPCPDGLEGCLVHHSRPQTMDERRAAIRRAMNHKTK